MSTGRAPIAKYHGTGNDFVVVDAEQWSLEQVIRLADAICDRHRGIGADGILHVETRPEHLSSDVDAMMTIINRDGSRPQMCGNGIRCVARYLVESRGFGDRLVIDSDAGPRPCEVDRDADPWTVDVDMGEVSSLGHVIWEDGTRGWRFHSVDVGNPHAVIFDDAPVETIEHVGKRLNAPGSPFSEGVNVEFVQVGRDGRLDVVVYERGVGFTQACGTGACAVAYAAWKEGIVTAEEVVVGLPGGDLRIRRDEARVWMRGDAESVFNGTVSASWLLARGD